MGIFLSLGILYTFWAYTVFEFGKTANSSSSICETIFPYLFRFVWRQLEFAFFGALTSVGALFVLYLSFGGKENEKTSCTNPCYTYAFAFSCL